MGAGRSEEDGETRAKLGVWAERGLGPLYTPGKLAGAKVGK